MVLKLTALLLLIALPVCAQDNPAGNQPGNAIPVRCVNTLGTAFEACGGGGAAGTDVNISGVGGVAVGVGGLPVTFANTSIAISGSVAVTGTFWQVTQPVSHANFANLDAALSTLANQTTLALIKAKTDNLDVLLSTRTKPADQQHAIVDSGAITATLAAETTKVIGTVNQGTSPWVSNVTQFGSAAVTLGQKTSANAIPVVRSSDELPPPDRQVIGDITTVVNSQFITTSGSGTTRLTIIGTWTGTLSFYGYDGTTTVLTKAINISTGALESSTTANGSWLVPTAGYLVLVVLGPTSSGTASLTFAASPASTTTSLAQSLPTGTNSIGQVTANAGTNMNTSLLALETTQQTGNSYLNVLANARNGPPLPLFPCNAVRQTKCQPKGY